MAHDIKCVGPNCGGVVVATVDLREGESYKGDAHYGFYCAACAPTLNPEE